jgi:replicative DNA helicase
MRAGELIGVAARTSVGKTAFAVQVAVHAAMSGRKVLFLTLEENPIAVALRGIATTGGVNLTAMRGGFEAAVQHAHDAVVKHDLTALPMWVDSRTFDLGPIRAKISKYARTEGIALAVVDHILLVNVPQRNGAKRYETVGEVTRTLKQTAEELGIPIIALAQLGRDAARSGKRPSLTDLRESGNIEQDLSTCIALHPIGNSDDESVSEQEIELGLLKNRYGRRGWMGEKLRFLGGIQRFEQKVSESEQTSYGEFPPSQRSFDRPEDFIEP